MGDEVLMFYNAPTRRQWVIAWAVIDLDSKRLVDRCDAPLIAPEPDGDRDIAFATSLIEDGDLIYLYFSHDGRVPRRATLRRR